jgi:hypothetical protein
VAAQHAGLAVPQPGKPPAIQPLPPAPDLSRGLCQPPAPLWWTSGARAEREAAARICQSCPVLVPCGQWALSLPDADPGVYAGMTQAGRRRRRAAYQAAGQAG